jgi:hypothetical protein
MRATMSVTPSGDDGDADCADGDGAEGRGDEDGLTGAQRSANVR